MEREYLNWVLTYKRRHSDLGKVSNLDPELTKEQREAVCTILFNRDQVIIFRARQVRAKPALYGKSSKVSKKVGRMSLPVRRHRGNGSSSRRTHGQGGYVAAITRQ